MGSLSIKRTIHARHIVAVKKLDPARPVYLLVGEHGSKIVIKRDTAAKVNKQNQENDPRSMRHTFRNMAAVDKAVAAIQLSRREIQSISRFASAQEHEVKNLNAFRTAGADDGKLYQDLQHAAGMVWIKTNFFEGLIDLEAAAVAAAGKGKKKDKSGIRAIAAALTAPGGLEKLGQIIAVDAFNGNNDRFNIESPANYEEKPHSMNLFDQFQNKVVEVSTWRLVNAGNVACCLQEDILKPVGMDPWSSQSPINNFETNEGPDNRILDAKWTGYILKDDPEQRANREQLGFDVEDDLETLLGPRNRKIFWKSSETKRLPKGSGARIARGIEEGAQTLKRKLLSMAGGRRRLPAGLIKRMEVLDWAVKANRGGFRPAPPKGRRPNA